MQETKYTEIFRLKDMLTKAKIEFIFHDRSINIGGVLDFESYQIIVNNPITQKRIISVIEGRGTYGEEENLLEIMGCLTAEEEAHDSVKGWLTAEEVFSRITKELDELGVEYEKRT